MQNKLKEYLNHSPPENGMLASRMFAGKTSKKINKQPQSVE